mgnify:CR=1 FL=1
MSSYTNLTGVSTGLGSTLSISQLNNGFLVCVADVARSETGYFVYEDTVEGLTKLYAKVLRWSEADFEELKGILDKLKENVEAKLAIRERTKQVTPEAPEVA